MPVRHIYWFAHYSDDCASVRNRGIYVLRSLSNQFGITSDIIVPGYDPGNIARFLMIWLKAMFFPGKDSVIVIQKVHSRKFYSLALQLLVRIRSKICFYDLDDAEHLRHPPEALEFFLRHVSGVVTGSEFLRSYALNFNSRATVITSAVPEHAQSRKTVSGRFTIGWVGDFGNGHIRSREFSHKKSLNELFFPVLSQIKFPVRLVLLGVKNLSDIPELEGGIGRLPHIELIIPRDTDWKDEQTVYEQIAQFDVGIAPLVPHSFNAAKSAFKVKQYLSCGVPVLASPVGENPRFIEPGKNGELCEGVNDFLREIIRFSKMDADEIACYRRHALNSREMFSMNDAASAWIATLDLWLSRPSVPKREASKLNSKEAV